MAPAGPEETIPLDFRDIVTPRILEQRNKRKATPLLGHTILALIVVALNLLPDQLGIISIYTGNELTDSYCLCSYCSFNAQRLR